MVPERVRFSSNTLMIKPSGQDENLFESGYSCIMHDTDFPGHIVLGVEFDGL